MARQRRRKIALAVGLLVFWAALFGNSVPVAILALAWMISWALFAWFNGHGDG